MSAEWTGFWAATAGVGATLLGLAFVIFQVQAQRWRRDRLKNLVAVFTLAELGTPAVISLVCMMPGHPWRGAAFVAGVLGLALVCAYFVAFARTATKDCFDRQQAKWSALTLVVAFVIAGSSLLPEELGLRVLGYSMVWLLCSGAIESWIFLSPRAFPVMSDSSLVNHEPQVRSPKSSK